MTEEHQVRLWNAWTTPKETGLIYEAVCLFDLNPTVSEAARLQVLCELVHSRTESPDLLAYCRCSAWLSEMTALYDM